MAHSSASIPVNTSLVTTTPIVDNVRAPIDTSIRTQGMFVLVTSERQPQDPEIAGWVGNLTEGHGQLSNI
jgi:hypothetical protein